MCIRDSDYYEPEFLVGKTLLAITNLPPRKMMGIDSCGMIISATHLVEGREGLTKGGEFIGAAVESSANGFGGALSVLVGFDKEGNIIDYSLLSHAETCLLYTSFEPNVFCLVVYLIQ